MKHKLKFDTGPDVEILFGRAVLVLVVGDGVRFIIRVGDATHMSKARGPARAVAVPARSISVKSVRMASNSKKKPLSWK